ncbi:MAG: hypothetical protein Q4A31_10900 [Corynebacterium sp.]|uniref:hypothetical protein n=1 Tax=Corynebacterium sp. TaxID=1720 RepID=UPI0026DD16D1|nr:hypothetical protein [Corynebacterium sp.]MDO4762417.1 hypothetical protein [Corynebacterium sp.]
MDSLETSRIEAFIYSCILVLPICVYYFMVRLESLKRNSDSEFRAWQMLFYFFVWAAVGVSLALLYSVFTAKPFWTWSSYDTFLRVHAPFAFGFVLFLRSGGIFKYPLSVQGFKPFLRWLKKIFTA